MALEDYYESLRFVEYRRVPDGFGGWTGQWSIGAEFRGLVTIAGDMVQNTEALRGNPNKQYKVSVPLNTPLKKGDKIAFDFTKNGTFEYAEITNDGTPSPQQATQQFKLFTAQGWELKDEQL